MIKQPLLEIFMLIISALAMMFFFTTARAATSACIDSGFETQACVSAPASIPAQR